MAEIKIHKIKSDLNGKMVFNYVDETRSRPGIWKTFCGHVLSYGFKGTTEDKGVTCGLCKKTIKKAKADAKAEARERRG